MNFFREDFGQTLVENQAGWYMGHGGPLGSYNTKISNEMEVLLTHYYKLNENLKK